MNYQKAWEDLSETDGSQLTAHSSPQSNQLDCFVTNVPRNDNYGHSEGDFNLMPVPSSRVSCLVRLGTRLRYKKESLENYKDPSALNGYLPQDDVKVLPETNLATQLPSYLATSKNNLSTVQPFNYSTKRLDCFVTNVPRNDDYSHSEPDNFRGRRIHIKFYWDPSDSKNCCPQDDAKILTETNSSHFTAHYSLKRKPAFTLTEVLITLGIIGVVAAMTMPVLIANHRKQEVVTKLKKIYTVMNQAINNSVAEYGDVELWAKDCGQSSSPTCTTDEAIEWFNTYIGKHLQILEIKKKDNNKGFYVYLNDGSVLSVQNYLYDMGFFINQKAIENSKSGVNCFSFRFNPVLLPNQNYNYVKNALKPTFEPYANGWDGTRASLINNKSYGCGNTGAFCTKLIQYDSWQISKDYPLRF